MDSSLTCSSLSVETIRATAGCTQKVQFKPEPRREKLKAFIFFRAGNSACECAISPAVQSWSMNQCQRQLGRWLCWQRAPVRGIEPFILRVGWHSSRLTCRKKTLQSKCSAAAGFIRSATWIWLHTAVSGARRPKDRQFDSWGQVAWNSLSRSELSHPHRSQESSLWSFTVRCQAKSERHHFRILAFLA